MARSFQQGRQGKKRKSSEQHVNGKQKKHKSDEVQSPATESPSKTEFSELVRSKLGVEMPDDFYQFWDFISKHLEVLSACGLTLTGPFDILCKRIDLSTTTLSPAELHLHGRCFFDPPEMMTVISSLDSSGFHIGYFRDSPSQMPVGLVSNKTAEGGQLTDAGGNIFAALSKYCQQVLQGIKKKKKEDPPPQKALVNLINAEGMRLGHSMSPKVKGRPGSIQSPTFHKFGIVVPVDANDVGYRELPLSDEELRLLLERIDNCQSEEEKNKLLDELDETINLIHFANDECDYGMGLEMGLDLFSHGSVTHHNTIKNLLTLAYQLLGRELYGEIVELHLENRLKDSPIDKCSG